MEQREADPRGPGRLAIVLLAAAAAGLLVLAQLRGSWSAVAGDESTYLAMIESLVRDGDLRFDEADAGRLEGAAPPSRRAVILQRTASGVSYSKPVVYPLLAAPFYALAGRAGLVGLALAVLGVALWLAWRRLRRRGSPGGALLTVVTFAGTGTLLPQAAWAMSDALQAACALAGLALVLDAADADGEDAAPGHLDASAAPRGGRWAAVLGGGVLLGLLISMRLPNAILAAAGVAATAVAPARGRWRRAVVTAAAVVAALLLATAANRALLGAASPYRAERATFNMATGYPAGPEAERAAGQFVAGRATQTLTAAPRLQPTATGYSALYFLIGRHTGLLVYLPAALLLAGAALRRPSAAGFVLLAGAAAVALFYLVWLPYNYFGGASFLGNRYFLPAYGALLLAPRRPLRPGWLLAVWGVAALAFGSALLSVAGQRGEPFDSQSHAYRGIFRRLPYESTALAIEGRRDRYLSDEFVRFVDPHAAVAEGGFRLYDGARPAELLLATERPSGILRFLVATESDAAELVYEDWRGRQVVPLPERRGGARGLVEVVAAPAWRRHPFWWSPAAGWRAHSLRLSVRTAGGSGSSAEVRYLGPYRLARKFFVYDAVEVELPERVAAGGADELRVAVRNRGRRPWASRSDVPIHVGYRLEPAEGAVREPAERLIELEGRIERGEVAEVTKSVRWPRRPGRYRVTIDLVAGGAVRFEEWLGLPVAVREVEVVEAAEEPPDGAREKAEPSP